MLVKNKINSATKNLRVISSQNTTNPKVLSILHLFPIPPRFIGTLQCCTLFEGYNDTIEFLDLSWNHLRNEGAKELALGLEVWNSV